MKKFARMERLPPYVFATVNELKMQMRRRNEDVIDLGMGNPDLPTPPHIVEKLVEAAQKAVNHRYSASRGIKGLRNAISGWYKRRFDVDIDPETEAVVTMGAKEGLAHLALVMLSPGDVVFATDPSYPIHPYSCIIAGADVRRIPISCDRDFIEDLLAATKQTWPQPKLLIISFPHNPTTATVDVAFFQRIVDFAKEHDIMVIHDFAYADFGFDGYQPPSFLQAKGAKDVGVEFFSLTKSYSMAGWRVGFCCGNPEMVHALTRIKSYLDYGIFQPIQIAATVALNGPQECVREIMDVHQDRRDALIEGLARAGWDVPAPKATMFVWAKIPEPFAHLKSVEFSKLLLREAGVAVSPGLGFGHFGDDHVRFALVENRHRINQAMRGIKKVLVRDVSKPRAVALPDGVALTADPDALVADPEIDIVVELMGGIDAAFALIHKALCAGKHVVTANKALLAERGPELFALAAQKGLGLYYEASCAGAIPIVETLKESLAGNRIKSIIGILNGTANYILSSMSDKGLPFAEALRKAQELGYAEADPTLDIEGLDAAHKLILLIRLAYGQNLPLSRLFVEGITRVTPEDIRFADEFGYVIKLIGQVHEAGGKLVAGVCPMLVHKDFLLASVKGPYNAVRVEGDAAGSILLHGRGAGDLPTGSAVLSDIMALSRAGMTPNNTGFVTEPLPDADVLDLDDAVCPHYIHFTVKDQPGVMAAISKSMGVHGVSIRQAVQKGEPEDGYVPIVFLTHEAPERAIRGVLDDAADMAFIKPGTVHFRVL